MEQSQNRINWNILERTQKIYITPELASVLLSKNNTNRSLRKNTVLAYSQQMLKGEWKENNPDPIILSRNGKLLNGQHRLNAVLKSEKTLSWNIYIMDKDDVDPMDLMVDQALKRNSADILKKDLNTLATINKFLSNSTYGSGFKPSISKLNEFHIKYLEDDDLICSLLKKIQKPLWANANYKSVALAYYLSGNDSVKEYVVDLISCIINKEIDKHSILGKVLLKISERSYSNVEHTKIAMILFNPDCAKYKIVKIMPNLSIPLFFRKHLDTIGFGDYYSELLPVIAEEKNKRYAKCSRS